MKKAIKQIYKNRQDFILIGLTGKIGAGCTTTANFLAEEKHDLPKMAISESSTDSKRKRYIVRKFYNKNWKPFSKIIASDVITSFLLEQDFKSIQKLFKKNGITKFKKRFESTYKKLHKEFQNINLTNKDSKKTHKFITKRLSKISTIIKQNLGSQDDYRNYTKAYQLIGNNLRLSGSIFNSISGDFSKIFTISERINKFVKIIRIHNAKKNKPTYIVIDAFRNPFEVMFFKERYSAFYLMAINAEKGHIEHRLAKKLKMTMDEIKEQDEKENPNDIVDLPENFVSQNIKACIQKSDLHVSNNGKYGDYNYHELYGQVIKFISLIQHPGLITPSLDEKMMQIAHTAKLNSACLSRQVGASITNYNGSLKAIGWNSVADGQTPCLLRSKVELLQGTKSKSYSFYEKSSTFKKSIQKFYPSIKKSVLKGRNQSFCFSEIHNNQIISDKNQGQSCKCDKNQVHTRSLHAEENAFLQISKYGGEGIKDGTLYSTASPCELCSKKAYQLGIVRVVYIDPYPGIAQAQILDTGLFPPKVVLFKGAIGTAYHKLYEPILSYKDELEALGK